MCVCVCTTVCEMVMREENFAELYPRRVAAGTTHSRHFWRKISHVAASTNAPVVSLVTGRRIKINPGWLGRCPIPQLRSCRVIYGLIVVEHVRSPKKFTAARYSLCYSAGNEFARANRSATIIVIYRRGLNRTQARVYLLYQFDSVFGEDCLRIGYWIFDFERVVGYSKWRK